MRVIFVQRGFGVHTQIQGLFEDLSATLGILESPVITGRDC